MLLTGKTWGGFYCEAVTGNTGYLLQKLALWPFIQNVYKTIEMYIFDSWSALNIAGINVLLYFWKHNKDYLLLSECTQLLLPQVTTGVAKWTWTEIFKSINANQAHLLTVCYCLYYAMLQKKPLHKT